MSKLVLAGGTDIAEMAIFNIDSLLDSPPSRDKAQAFERQGQAMTFDTGSDGEYLLHVYLNEEIPEDVMRYCIQADGKYGTLHLPSGRLGYGGSESMSNSYKPNPNIRVDVDVEPGTYQVSAFHTDYPEEVMEAIEDQIDSSIDGKSERILNTPKRVGLFVFFVNIVLFIIANTKLHWQLYFAIAIIYLAYKAWAKSYTSSARYRSIYDQHQVEQNKIALLYPPSIVVKLAKVSA